LLSSRGGQGARETGAEEVVLGYRPIIVEARREFPVGPGRMWDFLANTDHLNRSTGMPHVAFGPVTVTADAFYREAAALFWGLLRLRWREYPFEWVRGRRYAVLRLFESGFLDVFYAGVEITGEGESSWVRLFAELTPRTLLGWSMAKVMGKRGIRAVLSCCDRFVARRTSGLCLLLPPPPRVSSVDRANLDRLVSTLRGDGLPEPLIARVARHLAAASDAEVLRMQPYGLADGWGVDRRELLRLFVRAERQGALYHTWEVMCPNCRVPRAHATALADVPARFHCDGCGIAYDANLEESVELRYSVHPALRPAKDEVYCIGGPANTPHVWAQQYLPAGTERIVSLGLTDEPFRIRALRTNQTCPLEPEVGGSASVTFTYRPDGWFQMRQQFRPGPVSIRLRNEAAHLVVPVVEQVRWDPRAITAAQVLRAPDFQEVAALEPRT
jgi:adenylate cyclase